MNKNLELKKFIQTVNTLYLTHANNDNNILSKLKKYLKNIHTVYNENEALKAFKTYYQTNGKHYDIIIIDTDAIDDNSIDLCATILSQNQEQNFIILSDNESDLSKFIQKGIFNFIVKPINDNILESNILQIASTVQKHETIKNQHLEIETIQQNLKSAQKKALETSHQKSYFLANMSHEIRTPLNAIMGFITLLQDKENDKEKLKYLNILKTSSDTLLQVINDILDITKIESGKLEIDSLPFNPYDKLMHTTELFQVIAAQKGIIFQVKTNQSLPKTLMGDPFRLQQIFSNLLSNAIKFTPEGSIVKAVIWYTDGTLHIRVKDYGIGIAKDKHAYIFEAFKQADNRMATEYGGTGLGLALCAELSKLIGGELSFTDNPKQGCIFTLKVKIPEGKEEITESTDNKELANNTTLKGHILVVEDIEANRLFIGIVLSNMGLSYDTAVNGLDAIEKFKEARYDLILMDENMPGLNGVDAAKRILNLEEKQNLKHTPIITLSANALKGDKERFLAAGMDDYISKPVDPHTLFNTLRKYLLSS